MKKIIFLTLFVTLLFAQNPKVYSVLGDVIYDNVDNIEKLKTLEVYSGLEKKIDRYVADVKKAKEEGFAIENGSKTVDKKEYLKKLRELSSTNDELMQGAKSTFKASIENEDNELFTQIINTGLIDAKKYKSDIMLYYASHSEDINASGILQDIIYADDKPVKQKSNYKTKKQIQEEKIRRIRESDRLKQEAIQAALEEELRKKKLEIRKEQKKELSH